MRRRAGWGKHLETGLCKRWEGAGTSWKGLAESVSGLALAIEHGLLAAPCLVGCAWPIPRGWLGQVGLVPYRMTNACAQPGYQPFTWPCFQTG